MKLFILIVIAASVFAAQFEQGSILANTIEAHQIYKQDVKFRNQFDQVPKIVLSIAGYHSNLNTLDFFSRVTEVTDSGFQLQVISDAKIESATFNYLATDHSEIQTICNNIEVTKDQIDMKFQQPYESVPIAAAFITGIHRKSDDNILLEVKSVEQNMAHILTLTKAESSIGICLLVGPENVFTRKELPIMQISQGLPNNVFFGISSIAGVGQDGIIMDLSQKNVENSFELGLTIIEINQSQISQEENQAVSFEELINKLNPEDAKQEINSIQIKQDALDEDIAIHSISFYIPETQNEQYVEETNENLMTISESWLQHDINVVQDNEPQKEFLTNLVKPADFNEDSYETYNQEAVPQNVKIMDSTDIVISQNNNQFEIQNDNEIEQGNLQSEESQHDDATQNLQDEDLEEQIENLISEQMEQAEQSNIVEDLQEKVENIETQIETIAGSKQDIPHFDALKIIEEQQFIVNQQKQIVEQQQLIIQQYQQMLEDQKKILLSESIKEEITAQPQQLQQIEEQNDQPIEEQQPKVEEKSEVIPTSNQEDQMNLDVNVMNIDNETILEKDLESFNKLQKRKDEVDEKQVSSLLKDIAKDLTLDDQIENKMKKLEDGLVDVLNKRSDDIAQDILVNDSSLKKKVEFSNSNYEICKKSQQIDQPNDLPQDVEVEQISLEEISETIFPQQYEMEQAYLDWSLNTGIHKSELKDGDLQRQIDEFLEFDNKESIADPLFDDFHSFFSVNQQVRSNLRKRKVLNV